MRLGECSIFHVLVFLCGRALYPVSSSLLAYFLRRALHAIPVPHCGYLPPFPLLERQQEELQACGGAICVSILRDRTPHLFEIRSSCWSCIVGQGADFLTKARSGKLADVNIVLEKHGTEAVVPCIAALLAVRDRA